MAQRSAVDGAGEHVCQRPFVEARNDYASATFLLM
jgi:hypothetical protein